ncbi:MAG: hypothetical protein LAN71_10810 [Acidobacteriia bacterium]|nr:hypothetical protein [Terriglobia bacterium]
MKLVMKLTSVLSLLMMSLLLAACSGAPKSASLSSGTGSGTGSGTLTIGGTVSGLAGTGLVLLNNGGDNLTINANGAFTFKTLLAVNAAYSVTVLIQPTNPTQVCSVAAGSGTATANVGTIVVSCTSGTISIGGTVSGLAGTGLVLQDNGGDDLTVTANGTFTFATLLASGAAYAVIVKTQPTSPAQTCVVTNGSGTASANVTSVQVTCPAVFFTVGGQTVGVLGNGGGMVIQNNGGDNLPLSGNGPFTFSTTIAYKSTYDVSMFVGPGTQPQGCVIWGFQGTVLANVTDVLVDCGHNDWTWMAGSSSADQLAVSGTVSPTAQDNGSPGGRKYSATWTDLSGNLWLFGGDGWDTVKTANTVRMNDMWKYTGTQVYLAGFNTGWTQTRPTTPLPTDPVARWGSVSWTDAAGKLWLFAGQDAGTNFMNDLWSYDTTTNTWTYVNGGANQNGVYGTLGVASASNWPGGRWGATARVDAAGTLWLFGGYGFDSVTSSPGLLNDLWEFSGGQWTWVSGANTVNQSGVYGTQGTAAASNVPGGRQAPISWIDGAGNFLVFGGYNLSPTGQPNAFNDLWKYSGGQWTWVSGSSGVNQTGVYGTLGVAAATNVPGARWSSAAWTDPAGRLWLFGGRGYDTTANGSLSDLWQYSGGQWTWMKGPSSVNQAGVYGIQANPTVWPHVIDYPGGRWAPAYWMDPYDQLWIFGGEGYDSGGTNGNGQLNDLWRYLPYP